LRVEHCDDLQEEGLDGAQRRGATKILPHAPPRSILLTPNLVISNAAIYWTLVVQDIDVVDSPEPWFTSRGEQVVGSPAQHARAR
jgi:hypothetical protein